MRDRIWNNKAFKVQSKITDANISKLLSPLEELQIRSKTKDALSEGEEK